MWQKSHTYWERNEKKEDTMIRQYAHLLYTVVWVCVCVTDMTEQASERDRDWGKYTLKKRDGKEKSQLHGNPMEFCD